MVHLYQLVAFSALPAPFLASQIADVKVKRVNNLRFNGMKDLKELNLMVFGLSILYRQNLLTGLNASEVTEANTFETFAGSPVKAPRWAQIYNNGLDNDIRVDRNYVEKLGE